MPQKNPDNQSSQRAKVKLHAAALHLADEQGWSGLTLAQVYTQAGLAMPKDAVDAPIWPLVADILSSLDRETHAAVSANLGDNWRDNLFEILMTRFDLMQPHRAAYASILPSAVTSACRSAPLLGRSFAAAMQDMARQSGVPAEGLRRPLATAALGALYLSLLETWRQDDTADLAKTMAAVDKRLGWYEEFLSFGIDVRA